MSPEQEQEMRDLVRRLGPGEVKDRMMACLRGEPTRPRSMSPELREAVDAMAEAYGYTDPLITRVVDLVCRPEPTRPHDRTLYVRPNPRARRQRTVMIDDDAEIVVVLEREAAAAAVTHLQDVVSVLRKTGPAWRCGLVEGVVGEMGEQLRDVE